MTVAKDASVRRLIDRAKDGTIPPQEVKQIAQAVTEGQAGRELYPRCTRWPVRAVRHTSR